jgi:DivIVA domain-containing protein
MFRAATAKAVVSTPESTPAADLIPLSVLELDLPESATGWLVELGRRGVEIVEDDIGRPSISRDTARLLISEHHENLARQRESAARIEAEAVEADRVLSNDLRSKQFSTHRPGYDKWQVDAFLEKAAWRLAAMESTEVQ